MGTEQVRWRAPVVLLLAAAVTLWAQRGMAQPGDAATAATPEESPAVAKGRELFVEGAALARDMRWGDALARFEASAKLRAHAGTTYNIGICERALGRYTRARRSFRQALALHAVAGGTDLAPSTVQDIETFLREIEPVLGALQVTLDPPTAAIAVDGRPLERAKDRGDRPVLVAGTLRPGPGRRLRSGSFTLVLDPGSHVFVLSRKGYSKVVHRQAVRPGQQSALRLELARMPGAIRIDADQPNAAVAVDGVDVGVAPLTLSRPAGRYRVQVQKEDFVSYEADATVRAGERVELAAQLRQEETGLAERWWFWTGIAAVVAGAAVITYFAVQPEPDKPPLDGGGLGWTVRVP